jgi:cytidylate kinase
MKKIIIAIDGPSGSGKSTTARETAKKLNYLYIDTGAMYRAVTLEWIRSGQEFNEDIICELVKNIKLEIKITDEGQKTFLNDQDVSFDIRKPDVTRWVSPVSAIDCVRTAMVEIQRNMGSNGGVVMDGRDIGTVVFPEAHLKIFLVASIEERAIRRQKELMQAGIKLSLEEVKAQLESRDIYDSSRLNSPLKKAEDAILIDTSSLTIEEQTQKVVDLALQIINQ